MEQAVPRERVTLRVFRLGCSCMALNHAQGSPREVTGWGEMVRGGRLLVGCLGGGCPAGGAWLRPVASASAVSPFPPQPGRV